MSNIIKSTRIRNQTVINLSERLSISQIEAQSYESHHEESLPIEGYQEKIHQIELEAKMMLGEAKKQAQIILEQAQEEAQVIKQQMNTEKKQLLEQTLNEHNDILEQASKQSQQILQDAHDEKQKIINGIEGELAQTLTELLQYLVGEEVYNNATWVLCVVKRMLAQDVLQGKGTVKVYVASEVYNRLTEEEKQRLMEMREDISLEISDTLNPTSCRVETQEGGIEYDVYKGLEKVISDIKILQNVKQESL